MTNIYYFYLVCSESPKKTFLTNVHSVSRCNKKRLLHSFEKIFTSQIRQCLTKRAKEREFFLP